MRTSRRRRTLCSPVRLFRTMRDYGPLAGLSDIPRYRRRKISARSQAHPWLVRMTTAGGCAAYLSAAWEAAAMAGFATGSTISPAARRATPDRAADGQKGHAE